MTRFIAVLLLLAQTTWAATWYVDYAATGSNNGTSWVNAFSNLVSINWSPVTAGDTVEISGGDYSLASFADWVIPDKGLTNAPLVIKSSQATGHNGLVTIQGQILMKHWQTLDGSKYPNYETNLVSTFDVALVTNNCNIFISNQTNWAGVNTAVHVQGADSWGLSVKWCRMESGTNKSIYQATVLADGYHQNGIDIGYNWFSFCIGNNFDANQTSSPLMGGCQIHHNLFENFSGNLINVSGGIDFHHNYSRHIDPTRINSEIDLIQLAQGPNLRMYNNVMVGSGNSIIQGETTSARLDNWYIYGNLFIPLEGTLWHEHGPVTGIQINTAEWTYSADVTISNIYILNNTTIGNVTNGFASLVSFLNRAYAQVPTPSYPLMKPITNGIIIKNNLNFNTGSSGVGCMPAYHLQQGQAEDGWYYPLTNFVILDYNSMWSPGSHYAVSWADTTYYKNYREFANAAEIATVLHYTHNNNVQPTFLDETNRDYRLAATDTAARNNGVDLTSLTNIMPGLDIDLWGHPRGYDGAWDIGANEFSGDLLLHLCFMPTDWPSTGVIVDQSGNTNHGIRYSLTNWPTLTNGPRVGMYAAHYCPPTNVTQGEELHAYGEYVAVTNAAIFQKITNGTVAIWAYANSNSYGNSTLLDASSVGGIGSGGVWTNCWYINRGGNENFRFKVMDSVGDWRNIIYFPDDTIGHGSGPDAFTMTNWCHYAVTWDAAADRVVGYHNGIPCQTNTLDAPWLRACDLTLENPSNPRWVGVGVITHNGTPQMDFGLQGGDMYPNNGWFSGNLADMRIYARALTASEILDVWGGAPPEEPPLGSAKLRAGGKMTIRGKFSL
jgi:hypothetical protein